MITQYYSLFFYYTMLSPNCDLSFQIYVVFLLNSVWYDTSERKKYAGNMYENDNYALTYYAVAILTWMRLRSSQIWLHSP